MRSAVVLVSIMTFQISGVILLSQWSYDRVKHTQPLVSGIIHTRSVQAMTSSPSTTARIPIAHVWRASKEYYAEKVEAVIAELNNEGDFHQLPLEERQAKLAEIFLTRVVDDTFYQMPEDEQRAIQHYVTDRYR
ncbi:hypothetical protein [Desulfovibrio inopinatus]|uniref:hypothetical protein n=1 Tax=Desulfovibrio inopinatus TaxID=102109 RepID=UPI0004802F23|nr:hypothetical protein [Desulfovibrio inopinatus]